MKKALALLLCVLAICSLTGCASYYELCMNPNPSIKGDDDETVLATFSAINVSYTIFGVIPFESGKPWLTGDCPEDYDGGMCFFKDYATLDNSLKSIKSALRQVKSNRISNYVTEISNSSTWSLFILNRRVVRTNCLILAPKEEQPTDTAK